MKTYTIETHGGMVLTVDDLGEDTALPVIFLHGGGQTRHSWRQATRVLHNAGYRTINVDLRGHGDSAWCPDGRYGLSHHAGDIRAIAANLPRKPVLVGASLGGLASLLVAGETDLASGLVLVDVVPQLNEEGTREIRDFMLGSPNGFATLEEAAAAVGAYLPHRKTPPSPEGLRKNLRETPDGRFVWHWDPLLLTGDDRLNPDEMRRELFDAARAITVPTLLVRGATSRVVNDEGVRLFKELMPAAHYVNIEGADHMVAGDKNDAFTAPLADFVKRHVELESA